MTCPQCGAAITAADQFCESCGALVGDPATAPVPSTDSVPSTDDPARTMSLAPPRPDDSGSTGPASSEPRSCASCGGEIGLDGYCTVCGLKAVTVRDHWAENPTAWVAAVCDRGLRHARNEDGLAVSAFDPPGSFAALVVCDGVSSSTRSDLASLNAARAARDVLVGGRAGVPDPAGPAIQRAPYWAVQLALAAAAANTETIRAAEQMVVSSNPPSCTFVAAVVDGPMIVAGWVGDSRAYWLPDGAPGVQLSVDDSWATEQIALGVSREVAEADPRAHSITRWLGVDSVESAPRSTSIDVEGRSGWLLVCSDGLWNYCSAADALRALIDAIMGADGGAATPAEAAPVLVDWANAQGGHDNIAVALARLGAPTLTTDAGQIRSF